MLLQTGDKVKVLSIEKSQHSGLKVGDIGKFVLYPNETKDVAVIEFEHIGSGFDYFGYSHKRHLYLRSEHFVKIGE